MERIKSIVFLSFCLLLYSCEKADLAPVIVLTISEEHPTTLTIVEFDVSESYSANHSIEGLKFRWDWDANGVWDTEYSNQTLIKHNFDDYGVVSIFVEASDLDGSKSIIGKSLQISTDPDDLRRFTDHRDGNSYKVIKIGDQTWLESNMRFHTDEGSWFLFQSFQQKKLYGLHYTWEAALQACPPGHHLPSDKEWMELESYCGMSEEDLNGDSVRISGEVGRKLKSRYGWLRSSGTDEYGFRASGSGVCDSTGELSFWRHFSFFWTSTPESDNQAYARSLDAYSDRINRMTPILSNGFSVRCIRNK